MQPLPSWSLRSDSRRSQSQGSSPVRVTYTRVAPALTPSELLCSYITPCARHQGRRHREPCAQSALMEMGKTAVSGGVFLQGGVNVLMEMDTEKDK